MADPITLPDTTLDLSPYDIQVYDYDYVDKDTGKNRALEDWSQRLMQFAQAIEYYLNEARDVPDTVRSQLQGLVDDVLAAEQAVRNHIASVRLPLLEDGNELMLMRVNADATEYEVVHPSQLFSGWMQSLTVSVGGQEYPVISSPNVVLPEFGEYDLNSNDDYDRFIARLGEAMQAAASAERHENSASDYVGQSKGWADTAKEHANSITDEVELAKYHSDQSMRYAVRAISAADMAAAQAADQVKTNGQQFINSASQHAADASNHADFAAEEAGKSKQYSQSSQQSASVASDHSAAAQQARDESFAASDDAAACAEQSRGYSEASAAHAGTAAQHKQQAAASAALAEAAEIRMVEQNEQTLWSSLSAIMANTTSLLDMQRRNLEVYSA